MAKKWWLAGVMIILGIIATVVVWLLPRQLMSPLTTSPWFGFAASPTPVSPTEQLPVFGYLPYWNLAKVTLQPELTHLSYFSLTIADDGTLMTKSSDGNAEPGFHRLGSDEWLVLAEQARQQQTQLEITFSQLQNDDIEVFLSSQPSQQRFLQSLDSALLAYPFAGVHIDVEYLGTPSAQLRAQFVNFIKQVDQHLGQRYQTMPLRLDIYGGAGERQQLWDLPALEPYVDSFIMMAYDYHHSRSSVAGPVAPLFGGDTLWDGDIVTHLEAIAQKVPPSKIILGVPFYGYEWQTTTTDPLSTTYPRTGATASFMRIQELVNDPTQSFYQGWNEAALSPYLTYTDDNEHYVIFYEDGASLKYKLDLVRSLGLGGIAIWALGYDGTYRELWDTIDAYDATPIATPSSSASSVRE